MKRARTPCARALWTAFPSVHVLPEFLIKKICEPGQDQKHEKNDVPVLFALDLIRLRNGHLRMRSGSETDTVMPRPKVDVGPVTVPDVEVPGRDEDPH